MRSGMRCACRALNGQFFDWSETRKAIPRDGFSKLLLSRETSERGYSALMVLLRHKLTISSIAPY